MSHMDGLTRGLRGSKVGLSLAGFTRSSPQTFSLSVVVTSLCFIKTSLMKPAPSTGADVKTHTPEAWVSVFLAQALLICFPPTIFYLIWSWVSAFNCLAALWWTGAVVLQHKGCGSTSALSELIKSGWLCLIGHWGWIAIGCRSDVVSAMYDSPSVSTARVEIFNVSYLPTVRHYCFCRFKIESSRNPSKS